MRHLFNSRVEVLRLTGVLQAGTPTLSWNTITDVVDPYLSAPGQLMCRIDLQFLRPGRDQPMPAVAGRAPDRVGVLFLSITDALKAGDRIHTLTGPVTGTFEVRAIPDVAAQFADGHHMEVQIIEVAQGLTGVFPSAEPTG
jgi:hypothetical protein